MENDKSSKTEQTLDLWKGKLAHTSSGARRRPCPWRSSERPMCQLCQFLLSQYSLASWHDTHGFVPIASTTHHWCQHKAPCISAAPAIRSSGARSVAAPKRPPSQRAFAPSWIQIFEFRMEKFFFLREGHGQKTGEIKGGWSYEFFAGSSQVASMNPTLVDCCRTDSAGPPKTTGGGSWRIRSICW
jgi:hypothetical protein